MNRPVSYQIRVRDRLGQTMRRAFPTLQAETRGEDTLLTGALADQAALFGVLTQVEALGLELVEVRRRESPGRVTSPHPGGDQAEAD